MSEKFFSNFPYVNYNGSLARNIIMKSVIFKSILGNYKAFYPYQVNDGERADTIAYEYYGDSEYYWLVLLSNEIVDPYYEWPMTQNQFETFLNKKYGSLANAQQNIDHYQYVPTDNSGDNESYYNTNYTMSVDDYNYYTNQLDALGVGMKDFSAANWASVSSYDVEFQKNEKNRVINLISKTYLGQINREISSIFRK